MSVVANLEKQLKEAKEVVTRRDLAERLLRNKDFQKFIMTDFIVTDAARLVAESADPALSVQQRADAMSMAQAPGHLKRFIQMTVMMGNNVAGMIPQIEEAIVQERATEDQVSVGSQDDDGQDLD